MMNPFNIWRHHLANEAHRRYIAEHPTAAEIQRARERRLGPPAGGRATLGEWNEFVHAYLPLLQEDRLYKIKIATASGDQSWINSLKEPITWPMLGAYARSMDQPALRPPREWERAIRIQHLTGWSLVGSPTLVP